MRRPKNQMQCWKIITGGISEETINIPAVAASASHVVMITENRDKEKEMIANINTKI